MRLKISSRVLFLCLLCIMTEIMRKESAIPLIHRNSLFEFVLERALSAVISATTCTDVDSVVEAGTCSSYPFLYCESLE